MTFEFLKGVRVEFCRYCFEEKDWKNTTPHPFFLDMLTHYYFFKALDYPNDILDVWNGFEFGSILRPKVIAKYLRPRLRRAQRRSNQKIEHAFVSKRGSTPIVPLKRANYAHCLCLGGQVDSNLFVQSEI